MKKWLFGLLGTSLALLNVSGVQIPPSQGWQVPTAQARESLSPINLVAQETILYVCLLYTSPSPRDA